MSVLRIFEDVTSISTYSRNDESTLGWIFFCLFQHLPLYKSNNLFKIQLALVVVVVLVLNGPMNVTKPYHSFMRQNS